MIYALICTDKPDHLSVRMDNRPAHLEFLNDLGDRLKGAGPFLGADGKPSGSLVLIDCADIDDAKATAANDPYAIAGLFASVDIRPWNWLIKNPESK